MHWRLLAPLVAGFCLPTGTNAQTLYKFPGKDGEIIYTDRKPVDQDNVEVRTLQVNRPGQVRLEWQERDGRLLLTARNSTLAPVLVQLLPPASAIARDSLTGTWLVPADSSRELTAVAADDLIAESVKELRFTWLYGDPAASHRPEAAYRAPFPAAVSHPISQSWPKAVTHTTPDSRYAVDIAMPVGSNVLAARDGLVVEVASSNFRSSLEQGKAAARANLVRVMHDDGTFAIYAHLNWNSIRVRPGDRITRGQYIADSGNTGYSTGPHLHFVVLKNAGTHLESVPVRFAAAGGAEIVPTTGSMLTAY